MLFGHRVRVGDCGSWPSWFLVPIWRRGASHPPWKGRSLLLISLLTLRERLQFVKTRIIYLLVLEGYRAGEEAQRLRASTGLAESLRSVRRTHERLLGAVSNSSSRRSESPGWVLPALGTPELHIHPCRQNIHKHTKHQLRYVSYLSWI